MTLRCSRDRITSDGTMHVATRTAEGWQMSWIPAGRGSLTPSQALAAMKLAAFVGEKDRDMPPGSRLWKQVDGWAAELGLSTTEALRMIAEATLDAALAYIRQAPSPGAE